MNNKQHSVPVNTAPLLLASYQTIMGVKGKQFIFVFILVLYYYLCYVMLNQGSSASAGGAYWEERTAE